MRQRLVIEKVFESRTIGDKNIPIQEFMSGGKKYSVFGKTLPSYIKEGIEIDAEVRIQQGDNWTNYKITDIFIDGKSVRSQQGFNRGKSPEELELSCRSYALSYAKDLAAVSKIEVGNILDKATEFYNWMQIKPTVVTPTVTAVKDTAGLEVLELPEPITAEQKERLKELQEKLPGRALQLIKEWGWEVKSITKLTKDQAKHLIEVMEAEQPLFPKADDEPAEN